MKDTTGRPKTVRMMRTVWCCLFGLSLLFGILCAASCHLQDDPSQRRVQFAEKSKEDIHLGIAWPFSLYTADLLREGVSMALDEVNQAGGVLGRKLHAEFRDDHSSSHQGLVVAQEFANDPKMLYVIGHCDLNVTMPASLIYQVNGLLFITPGTAGSKMARRGFGLVFNSYNTEREIYGSLAAYCSRRKAQRIVLVYQNTLSGIEATEAFEERAGELGLDIVARLPYDRPDRRVIRNMVTSLEYVEAPDMVLAVGLMPGVAQVIAGLRQLGVTLPIVGSADLETDQYLEIAGAAAEGTVVPSSFDLSSQRREVWDFARRFEAVYHKPPDAWAAQGYDAVKLLAFAVHQANSAVPTKVAAILSRTRDWPGVTGLHTFNAEGEVEGKPLVLKEVKNGQFVFLEEVVTQSGSR